MADTRTVLVGVIDADPDSFSLDISLRPLNKHQVKLTISTSADRPGALFEVTGTDLHGDAIVETGIDIAEAFTTPVETTLKFANVSTNGIVITGMDNEDVVTIIQPYKIPVGLFNAIYDRWVAMMGGILLYNTEADDKAVYPYGTFALVSAVTELADFTEDWENCLIQFNLFDDNSQCIDIEIIYTLLKEAFHKYDLIMDDGIIISLVKEVANLIRIEGVWQYNVSYRILIQTN